MHTPAHAVLNLCLLARPGRPGEPAAVAVGALLPDLPMFLFYAVERARGLSEREIFAERYFDPRWQAVFDLPNALPLIGIGALLAVAFRQRLALLLFASMGVHAVLDLLLHNDDAHRHFWPLSDWRFLSPVSYWDPRFHGELAALGEIALVVFGATLLWRRHPGRAMRVFVAVCAGVYAFYLGYVILVWLPAG